LLAQISMLFRALLVISAVLAMAALVVFGLGIALIVAAVLVPIAIVVGLITGHIRRRRESDWHHPD